MQTQMTFDMNSANEKRYGEIQNLPTPLVFNNSRARIRKYSLVSPTLSNDQVFPISESPNDADYENNANASSNGVDVGKGGVGYDDRNTDSSAASIDVENGSPSCLHIPKARQKSMETKKVLADKNISNNQRYFSEFRVKQRIPSSDTSPSIVNTFEDLTKQMSPYSPEKSSFLPNIRPVDRVVSLPFHDSFVQHSSDVERRSKKIDPKLPQTEPLPKSIAKSDFSTNYLIQLHSIDEPVRPQFWKLSCEIGEGSFSKVYLADDGKTAIKVTDIKFNKDGTQSSELQLRIQNSLTRELGILRVLDHPNIIKLVGTDYDSDRNAPMGKITMAIEYCKGGDLYSFILAHRSEMTSELIRCIFANIVSAVSYMHKMDVCHRDIKLENILLKHSQLEILNYGTVLAVKHNPIAVLSDFGLSKKIDPLNPMLTTRCGSEDYVSPELLLGMPYDGKQNDCWSLGVVLYTMLESRLPFDPLPNERENRLKRKSKPAHRIAMILWEWYVMKDLKLSEEYGPAKQIVKRLLAKRNKRATIDEIRENPWCAPYIIESSDDNGVSE
ncbi:hypothetical protein PMKS-000454 [Pichia membranifaciens]|uniref:non-specific serine/threonine protein kinase n=1 Tax=Pichia membranifaciens TaxID=4926 RepID=A0A1Q2YC47_9ASCO|nr:hypothetical protein PMKS-000454 [Pichia membranifaciens]